MAQQELDKGAVQHADASSDRLDKGAVEYSAAAPAVEIPKLIKLGPGLPNAQVYTLGP